ncbi:hypothetical protein AA313_de0201153 [Arthrobotrys entomopaga]|nr:hypothetical protein AA313_de0201153 [Arthrobotrys entomopaga]
MSSAILRRTIFTRLPTTTIARPLSTSYPLRKSVTDTVKDTVDTIDKKAGATIAAGIQKTEDATEAVKDSVSGVVGAAQDKTPTANQAKGMAKGKASELQGKAQQAQGEAKGKVDEISKSPQYIHTYSTVIRVYYYMECERIDAKCSSFLNRWKSEGSVRRGKGKGQCLDVKTTPLK